MRRLYPHDDAPKRRAREPAPPVPTLAELRSASPWFWVYCRQNDCTHYAPMAFVPLMIRWGADASSDRLRQVARCTRCGGKGAMPMHPSYVDRIVSFQPFPVETWLTAPVEKAMKLQRPLADKLLKVVATGEKKDAA